MAKRTCIICGEPTGSKEHLFPAALGGRRVNSAIYCSEHNRALGAGAAVLAEQLRVINSILSVESDRDRKVAHYPVAVEDGRILRVVGGHATLAAQFDVMSDSAEVTTGTLHFQSEAEFQAWLGEQRDAGNRVELGERQISPPKYYSGRGLELTFGGSEGLRAIAYLALTYFAHHFPDASRRPELRGLKGYVLGQELEVRSGWARAEAFANLPANPFEFGHLIAVGIRTDGKAQALVSLFGSLNFAVDIAHLPRAGDVGAVATFIDPLARGAPGDVHEVVIDPGALGEIEVERSQQILEDALADGRMQSDFGVLFDKINVHVNRRDVKLLQHRFHDIATLSVSNRANAIANLLDEQDPTTLILRLSERVVNGLKFAFEHDPKAGASTAILDELFAFDSSRSSGLSVNTEALLPAMRDLIGQLLLEAMSTSAVDVDALTNIFAGDRGARLIGEMYISVLNQLARQLQATNNDPENFEK